MAASKRFMNWTGVAFTPAGGSAIMLTGVSAIAFDAGGSLAKFSGDGDRYNTTVVNDMNDPSVSVTMADIGAATGLAVGTAGTLVATLNDARNGSGSGALTMTFLALVADNSVRGQHRQYGQATVKFSGQALDGQTNPLSWSVAS